jgi:hypothetical protein
MYGEIEREIQAEKRCRQMVAVSDVYIQPQQDGRQTGR